MAMLNNQMVIWLSCTIFKHTSWSFICHPKMSHGSPIPARWLPAKKTPTLSGTSKHMCQTGFLINTACKAIYAHIWANYNNSLTWIKAIWGWLPLLIMIPVRSQWGRYNLPRTMVLLDKISSRYPNIQSPRLDSAWSAGADGRPGWDLSVSMFDEWLMNHGNLPSGYLT